MSSNGKLSLSLVDVYGKRLKQTVNISLRNTMLTHAPFITGKDASKTINISPLETAPKGTYLVDIDPPSYHPIGQFVNIKTSGVTELEMVFPVDPSKVVSVDFQTYPKLAKEARDLLAASGRVFRFEGKSGADLYDAPELDDVSRAGLLNITAKCLSTLLTNGRTVFSYFTELKELRGDRFFVAASRELREEAKNGVTAGLFNNALQILHQLPPRPEFAGFSHAGSVKTKDHFGNLQLTFYLRGDDCVVDVDIDDAGGLEHFSQVLKNALTHNPTHPYNIHDILIHFQKVFPDYQLNVA